MRMTLKEFENRLQQVSAMTAEAAYALSVDIGMVQALRKEELAASRLSSFNAFDSLKVVFRSNTYLWVLLIHNLYDESEKLSLSKAIKNAERLLGKINRKRALLLLPPTKEKPNELLTKEKLNKLLEMLGAHSEAGKQLKTYRDQYVAHRDPNPKKFTLKLYCDNDSIHSTVLPMLETAVSVVESLQSYCLCNTWTIDSSTRRVRDDVARVADALVSAFPSEENPLPPPL